jgi:hypothetical protein
MLFWCDFLEVFSLQEAGGDTEGKIGLENTAAGLDAYLENISNGWVINCMKLFCPFVIIMSID